MITFWHEFGQQIQANWEQPVRLLVIMWLVQISSIFVGHHWLNQFGIHSWRPLRLWAIITAPFVHSNWFHLISNTIPFLIFGSLLVAQGDPRLVGELSVVPYLDSLDRFTLVTVFTALTSGIFAFLGSAPGRVTVGASGIVFGYFGYLVTMALREGRTEQMVMATFLVIIWGASTIRGVIPRIYSRISWQGHLGGLLGGIALGYLLIPLNGNTLHLPPAVDQMSQIFNNLLSQ